MRAYLEGMANIQICEKSVTIKTTVKPETVDAMKEMVSELMAE